MTSGQKLFNHLAAARMANGGKLSEEKWIAEADAFIDRERPLPKKRKQNVLGKGQTDDEWLADLAKDPDLAGVNIRDEARKCRVHFKGKNVVPSRQRVLKWLANAPVTLGANSGKETEPLDIYKEPDSDRWRRAARNLWPGATVFEANWFDLGTTERARILREMTR